MVGGQYQMLLDLRECLLEKIEIKSDDIKRELSSINHSLKFISSNHARAGKTYDLVKSFCNDKWYLSIDLRAGKKRLRGILVFKYDERVEFIEFRDGFKAQGSTLNLAKGQGLLKG